MKGKVTTTTLRYNIGFSSNMLNEEGRRELAKLMYDWGLEDAERPIKILGIKRDLHGCAIALLAMHRIFGIKSRIVRETENEIVIQATKCLWKDKKGWTPAVCATIDMYEVGLVKGINKNIRHICTERRSKGDKVCELILKPSD